MTCQQGNLLSLSPYTPDTFNSIEVSGVCIMYMASIRFQHIIVAPQNRKSIDGKQECDGKCNSCLPAYDEVPLFSLRL